MNYQSDFKILEGLKDGTSILSAPFRFTYFVKMDKGVYVAEYNGSEFINCHPTNDGRVVVPFDSPKLGMGVLMVKREFFLNDKDFADGICNLVSVESTGITLDRGATDMDGEVNIELFPFYQQGETGKSAYQEWLDLGNEGTTADFIASLRGAAFTYEDFTPEQLEALKGKDGKDGQDGIDGKDGSDASVVLSTHSALFHDDSESSNPIAIRLSSGIGEYAESADAYLGNEGLYISSNRSLGILLSSESGLEIGANAVVDGKTFDSGRGLSVKVGTGLIKDGNGLSVKVSTDGSIESTLEGGVRVGTLSIGADESQRHHIRIGTGLETTGNRNIFIDSKKLIGTSSEAMYQVPEDAISSKQGYGYRLRTGVRLSTMRDLDDYIDANSIVLGSAIILNNGDVPEIGVYYGYSFGVDKYNRLKIANNGVQSQHIATNSIGENHIQEGSINEYALQRYAVTSEALRNESVTEDKLSEAVKEKLNKSSEFSGSASDVTYEGELEATNVQEAIDELSNKRCFYRKTYSVLSPAGNHWYLLAEIGDDEATTFQVSTKAHSDVVFSVATGWKDATNGSLTILNSFIAGKNDNYAHVKGVRLRKENGVGKIEIELDGPIANDYRYVGVIVTAITNSSTNPLKEELIAVTDANNSTIVQSFTLQDRAMMADKVVANQVEADNIIETIVLNGSVYHPSGKTINLGEIQGGGGVTLCTNIDGDSYGPYDTLIIGTTGDDNNPLKVNGQYIYLDRRKLIGGYYSDAMIRVSESMIDSDDDYHITLKPSGHGSGGVFISTSEFSTAMSTVIFEERFWNINGNSVAPKLRISTGAYDDFGDIGISTIVIPEENIIDEGYGIYRLNLSGADTSSSLVISTETGFHVDTNYNNRYTSLHIGGGLFKDGNSISVYASEGLYKDDSVGALPFPLKVDTSIREAANKVKDIDFDVFITKEEANNIIDGRLRELGLID